MKEINLRKVMVAYAKSEESYQTAQSARDWAKRCEGSVWATREAECAEQAQKVWLEHNKELNTQLESTLVPVLSDIQKRATARTILASDIASELYEVEKKLGIPKKSLEGVEVSIDRNAQNFPRAYKYRPESTHFDAVFKNGCWRVTDIRRDWTRSENQKVIVSHTEKSKSALLDRFTIWS